MIIIGEKLNGAIPGVKTTIAERNAELIRSLAAAQDQAGAHFIDCAPSTAPEAEYDAMIWMIRQIRAVTEKPVSIDSPDAALLARILDEGHITEPGMVNSVNEEGDKCEKIFPLIAGTDWHVIGLTCDKNGIPSDPGQKIDIAKSIIDKAAKYGVKLSNLHIDACEALRMTDRGGRKYNRAYRQGKIGVKK